MSKQTNTVEEWESSLKLNQIEQELIAKAYQQASLMYNPPKSEEIPSRNEEPRICDFESLHEAIKHQEELEESAQLLKRIDKMQRLIEREMVMTKQHDNLVKAIQEVKSKFQHIKETNNQITSTCENMLNEQERDQKLLAELQTTMRYFDELDEIAKASRTFGDAWVLQPSFIETLSTIDNNIDFLMQHVSSNL